MIDGLLAPGDVRFIGFLMPFIPLPSFQIQVQDPDLNFSHVVGNGMDRKVVFHLGNPP